MGPNSSLRRCQKKRGQTAEKREIQQELSQDMKLLGPSLFETSITWFLSKMEKSWKEDTGKISRRARVSQMALQFLSDTAEILCAWIP